MSIIRDVSANGFTDGMTPARFVNHPSQPTAQVLEAEGRAAGQIELFVGSIGPKGPGP
jgi:hypothetical protein